MIVHRDIDQGTPDWFKIKWGKIGGTRSKGLFVESDTLLLHLVAERTEDYQEDDGFQNYDMVRGQELEPIAVARVESYSGIKFENVGWIDSDIPGLGISPDGLSECERFAAETKCLSRKEHVDLCLSDEIPLKYRHQCLHYFTVNPKLEKLYFCAFRPESNIRPVFIKELTRSSELDLGITEKGKITEDRGLGMKEYVANIPVIKTVDEWVEIAKANAIELDKQVNDTIDKMSF